MAKMRPRWKIGIVAGMATAAFIAGSLVGCLAGWIAHKLNLWHGELISSRSKVRKYRGLRIKEAATLLLIVSATVAIAWKIGR